jgi:hypothetical protein
VLAKAVLVSPAQQNEERLHVGMSPEEKAGPGLVALGIFFFLNKLDLGVLY